MGRKRRDVDGAYFRAVQEDSGPFVFLFEAYRYEWRSYKAVYMVIKFLNVLIITLMTKVSAYGHRAGTLQPS